MLLSYNIQNLYQSKLYYILTSEFMRLKERHVST